MDNAALILKPEFSIARFSSRRLMTLFQSFSPKESTLQILLNMDRIDSSFPALTPTVLRPTMIRNLPHSLTQLRTALISMASRCSQKRKVTYLSVKQLSGKIGPILKLLHRLQVATTQVSTISTLVCTALAEQVERLGKEAIFQLQSKVPLKAITLLETSPPLLIKVAATTMEQSPNLSILRISQLENSKKEYSSHKSKVFAQRRQNSTLQVLKTRSTSSTKNPALLQLSLQQFPTAPNTLSIVQTIMQLLA